VPIVAAAAPAAVEDESAASAATPAAVPTTVAATSAVVVAEAASAPGPEPKPEPASVEKEAPGANFGVKDEGPGEFMAKVTDLRKKPYGELVILLDNGQIWEQKHVDNRFRLKIGEEITISKGLVSGYRLSGKSNSSIQVERIK
jgi:hypothetical protein